MNQRRSRCGMQRDRWSANAKDGKLYCCRGCAEGTGCNCGSN